MKNVQVIDGADNCVYDIFAFPDDVFALVFSAGTDIAFVEDLQKRADAERVFRGLESAWANRLPKEHVNGIHGTLFYGLAHKRKYYPTLRDAEASNPDGSHLRAPTK